MRLQCSPERKTHHWLQSSLPLSLMCHLAVKSRGNNRITFPIKPSVIEPYSERAQCTQWGKEKTERERALQVSKCHRRASSHHMHTPCFVSDTTGTIYTYIMRLSGLYCSQYILPVQRASSQNKLNHHRNLIQKQLWLTFM